MLSTPPRSGQWSQPFRPSSKRIRPLQAILIALALIVAGAILIGIFVAPTVLILETVVLGCALSLVLNFIQIVIERFRPPAPEPASGFLENLDDPNTCVVGLTIRRNDQLVGSDTGVAWFSDGCLLFSGEATSFVVGGQDLLPANLWGEEIRKRNQHENPFCLLPLDITDGSATVELRPVSYVRGDREIRFLARLYAFRERPPISEHPRQWPPFQPNRLAPEKVLLPGVRVRPRRSIKEP